MIAIVVFCVITAFLVYYQVFTQGIFSCMIMTVMTVVSAIVALNYCELLTSLMGDYGLGKFAGPMLPLLAVFAVTLLVLRSAVDKLVRGNMKFPQMIDRAGSAVFALISSLVITGMIMIGFQMAPIGEKILGFTRCPDPAKPQERRNWYPLGDKLAVSIFTQGSKYCFSGSNKIGRASCRERV